MPLARKLKTKIAKLSFDEIAADDVETLTDALAFVESVESVVRPTQLDPF